MFNISFMTCIRNYIGHKSLEDQTLSRQNGCLTPSHSVTQPSDLGFWFSRSSLVFICFGQNVTKTTNHVNIWQIIIRTPSYVTLFCFFFFCFPRYVILFNQGMERFSHVFCNQYFFFCIKKNKWRLHTIYPKREAP